MAPYYLLLVVLGLFSVAIGAALWFTAYRLIKGYFTLRDQVGRATFERTNEHGVQEFSSWDDAKKTVRSEGFADMRSGCGLVFSPVLFLFGCLAMSGGYYTAKMVVEMTTMTETEFRAKIAE